MAAAQSQIAWEQVTPQAGPPLHNGAPTVQGSCAQPHMPRQGGQEHPEFWSKTRPAVGAETEGIRTAAADAGRATPAVRAPDHDARALSRRAGAEIGELRRPGLQPAGKVMRSRTLDRDLSHHDGSNEEQGQSDSNQEISHQNPLGDPIGPVPKR